MQYPERRIGAELELQPVTRERFGTGWIPQVVYDFGLLIDIVDEAVATLHAAGVATDYTHPRDRFRYMKSDDPIIRYMKDPIGLDHAGLFEIRTRPHLLLTDLDSEFTTLRETLVGSCIRRLVTPLAVGRYPFSSVDPARKAGLHISAECLPSDTKYRARMLFVLARGLAPFMILGRSDPADWNTSPAGSKRMFEDIVLNDMKPAALRVKLVPGIGDTDRFEFRIMDAIASTPVAMALAAMGRAATERALDEARGLVGPVRYSLGYESICNGTASHNDCCDNLAIFLGEHVQYLERNGDAEIVVHAINEFMRIGSEADRLARSGLDAASLKTADAIATATARGGVLLGIGR